MDFSILIPARAGPLCRIVVYHPLLPSVRAQSYVIVIILLKYSLTLCDTFNKEWLGTRRALDGITRLGDALLLEIER